MTQFAWHTLKPVEGILPEAYVKAAEAYRNAWEAYREAGEACMPAILALHAIECPNSPWGGISILFPKEAA